MEPRVVVIGGGGGGLCAAIAAREAGCDVSIVSKTPVGYGNCTAYSACAFSLGVGGLAPDRHKEITLKTGRFVNESHMVESLVNEAPELVPRLMDYGVPIKLSKGRATLSRGARNPLMLGEQMTRPLRAYARHIGVDFIERPLCTSVRTGSRGVRSVMVLELTSGEAYEVPASAVVVATGGAGQIYGRTDNPIRTTGDGYRLLYDCGVALQDMEFVQFYPLGFAEEGFAPWYIDLGVMDFVPLTNSRGERFLNEKLREWGIETGARANIVARDRCSIAVAQERAAGREVLLHVESLPAEHWKEHPWPRVRYGFPPGKWPPREPLRVAPTQHYFCGGATVGKGGRTEIPGLYACGEVTGGTDGANRVGGNALSAIVVFGFRSGETAAEYALSRGPDASEVKSSVSPRELGFRIGSGPDKVLELRKAINEISDEYLGPVRCGSGLKRAISMLEEMFPHLKSVGIQKPRDAALAFELQNLWLSAYAVACSAALRRESRGVHWRSDFQEECSAWGDRRISFLKREEGLLGVTRITARLATRLGPE